MKGTFYCVKKENIDNGLDNGRKICYNVKAAVKKSRVYRRCHKMTSIMANAVRKVNRALDIQGFAAEQKLEDKL